MPTWFGRRNQRFKDAPLGICQITGIGFAIHEDSFGFGLGSLLSEERNRGLASISVSIISLYTHLLRDSKIIKYPIKEIEHKKYPRTIVRGRSSGGHVFPLRSWLFWLSGPPCDRRW